jgi:glyoxylase-like metal-dependent hydrolase (beta-lactamase superfamily II)
MRVRQITGNLIQLTRLRFVNAYLVREDDGFTLVDTTVSGSGDAILDAAAEPGAPIRRIAITHGHGDHVGSLDELRGRLNGEVQVSMPELDARIHAGEDVVDEKLPGSWPDLETQPDVLLEPGDRIGSLEVIEAPGHTPRHVAFFDTRDRTLFAGDVFTTLGGTAVSRHFTLPFPLASMSIWDKERNLESARTLRALEPQLLAVGHGDALRDPESETVRAIERAIARSADAARSAVLPLPD